MGGVQESCVFPQAVPCLLFFHLIRDWSLISGRGAYKMGGEANEVLPLQKGWAEKVSANGGTIGFEVVFIRELEVLAILKGHKKFPPFKSGEGGRARKSFTLS